MTAKTPDELRGEAHQREVALRLAEIFEIDALYAQEKSGQQYPLSDHDQNIVMVALRVFAHTGVPAADSAGWPQSLIDKARAEAIEAQWQSIETAPVPAEQGRYSDPFFIIGYTSWGQHVGKFHEHVGPCEYYFYDEQHRWEFKDTDCDVFPRPTHWMPWPTHRPSDVVIPENAPASTWCLPALSAAPKATP